MAYQADAYSKCWVSDVLAYLKQEKPQSISFRARIREVRVWDGSSAGYTFALQADGWLYAVKCTLRVPSEEATQVNHRLSNWALKRTKVTIEGRTRPEQREVQAKSITGIVEETIKAQAPHESSTEESSPLIGVHSGFWGDYYRSTKE